MKVSRFAMMTAAIFGLLGTGVQAGLVTGVTSANNAVALVTGISGTSYAHVSSGLGTGAVTIDLDVFQMHVPVQIDFAYAARGVDPLATDYAVTLRVRNMITNPQQANNFKGFDLLNSGAVTPDVLSAGLRGPVAITSDTFATQYFGTLNIPGGFRWGGLNGGGPTLAPGATAVNTFVYRVTWSGSAAGASALTFVANPEPATMLLGGLAMVPAWVIARRRKATSEIVSA